ncbi:MAG: class II aldolase/adducin family protein [Bacillota bacterium]|nr:class II aldolase/adducin family protein [Bacillota bacterium]
MNQQLIDDIIEAGRRLYLRGMVAANDGNISARDGEQVYITASGLSKGFLKPEQIIAVDLWGRVLQAQPGYVPSIETELHLGLYRRQARLGALVHAHPPYATAFALSGRDINAAELVDLKLQLGQVPTVPYAPPGTPELAEYTAALEDGCRAALLARHGAIALGESVEQALFRMEALEQAAKIIYIVDGLARR